jgi:hypothetical protein
MDPSAVRLNPLPVIRQELLLVREAATPCGYHDWDELDVLPLQEGLEASIMGYQVGGGGGGGGL